MPKALLSCHNHYYISTINIFQFPVKIINQNLRNKYNLTEMRLISKGGQSSIYEIREYNNDKPLIIKKISNT